MVIYYIEILLILYVLPLNAQDDLVRLYRHLMNNYEKDIRPAANHSLPLNVTFGFSLTQIIDVDERNQILTTNAWINQNWLDYKLTWNPEKFGNITLMHIPHRRLWKPDIVLYNNADSHYESAVVSTDLFVSYDGNVTWLSAAIFKSSCQMNVRYYPFDEQSCVMKFASWAYDGTKIDLILVNEKGDTSNYMTSTEFKLINIKAKKNLNFFSCCPEPFPDLDIIIRIKRRPLFYVFNLILPCILITAVALLGFYMPSDSGEKVTLGITTLLSMTVFLMMVAESMPPTSNTLPLIGMYYGVTICLVSFATAMTVFTLNIHHKGVRGRPVPSFAKKLAFGFLAKIMRINLDTSLVFDDRTTTLELNLGPGVAAENQPLTMAAAERSFTNGDVSPMYQRRVTRSNVSEDDKSPTPENSREFESQFLQVLNRVYGTIERNEARLAEQDRREAIKVEWQQVALVADRFLLICFVLITTISSLAIIYQRELNLG